jgi:hypothetical protein
VDTKEVSKSCCAGGSSVVKELSSEEEFNDLVKKNMKVVVKFTAR